MGSRRYRAAAILLFALALLKIAVFLLVVTLCVRELSGAAFTGEDLVRTRWMLQFALLAGVGSLVCTLGAAAAFMKMRSAQILALEQRLREFRESEFQEPWVEPGIEPLSGAEIERLRRSLAETSDRVASRIGTLTGAERRLRLMFAELSHDIRTPLALLKGYIDTLRSGHDMTSSERFVHLDMAARHVERLETLVGQLVQLAELESGAVMLNLQAVAISEFVEDACAAFSVRAREAGVDLGCDARENLPPVMADPDLLERVFENLLDNALTHSAGAAGWVKVSLQADQRAVMVEIRNSGPAISGVDLEKIFDHSHPRASRGREGHMGLGLAIVHRILEMHGTEIRVTSSEVEGTNFRFDLPVAPGGSPGGEA